MKTRAEICTHVGKVRHNNEDNFFLNGLSLAMRGDKKGFARSRRSGEDVQLFAVCDGMGGQAAGEEAAALGVRMMGTLLEEVRHGGDARELMERVTGEANDAVVALGKDAGSTLTMLLLQNGEAQIAWLGDSRAYLLRNGELFRLTEDHTQERRMQELGLTAVGALARNALTRHLGMDMPGLLVTPSFAKRIPLKRHDVFLLCSDGLTGFVEEQTIAHILDESERPARELVNAALAAGGGDNVTALVVDVTQIKALFPLLSAKGTERA